MTCPLVVSSSLGSLSAVTIIAFENVIIRHDGDLVITDKHVEIGKNYDIPRTNSFPENDYQLTDALREVREV